MVRLGHEAYESSVTPAKARLCLTASSRLWWTRIQTDNSSGEHSPPSKTRMSIRYIRHWRYRILDHRRISQAEGERRNLYREGRFPLSGPYRHLPRKRQWDRWNPRKVLDMIIYNHHAEWSSQ